MRFRGKELPDLKGEELRAVRRYMQIIFQDPFESLNPRRTVGGIIGAPMVLHGIANKNEVEERTKEILERVGLQASYSSRYPHEFSGGLALASSGRPVVTELRSVTREAGAASPDPPDV